MGSRAVVVAAAMRRCAGGGSASSRKAAASCHAHRAAVLRRCCGGDAAAGATVRGAMTAAGWWERFPERLVLPRLRADALVGQGPGAAAAAVCRRRFGGRGEPARGGRTAGVSGCGPAGLASRCARAAALSTFAPPRLRRAAIAMPTPATAGRCSPSPTCGSRRFTCWPPRGTSSPTRITCGTCRRWRELRRPSGSRADADPATRHLLVDLDDAGAAARRARAGGKS